MRNIYTQLLLLIAGSAQRELARQVRYLTVENKMIRGKVPGRITVTPQERARLVRFGAKLGRALDQLVTIVHPDTLRRWIREDPDLGFSIFASLLQFGQGVLKRVRAIFFGFEDDACVRSGTLLAQRDYETALQRTALAACLQRRSPGTRSVE